MLMSLKKHVLRYNLLSSTNPVEFGEHKYEPVSRVSSCLTRPIKSFCEENYANVRRACKNKAGQRRASSGTARYKLCNLQMRVLGNLGAATARV